MLRVVLAVVVLVVSAAAVDVVVLRSRIRHVAVRLPHGGPGETWVVIGSDSRSDIPAGADQAAFGSTTDVPGARADVVLVVHRDRGRTTTVEVPRDLLVSSSPQLFGRITLAYQQDGAQGVVDGLCRSLGIAATHVVVLDMAGFARIVDELGGIDVDVPYPVADAYSGLRIDHGGRQRLDGTTALALVRSRHPVPLGTAEPAGADEAAGAAARALSTTAVFAAVRAAVHADRDDPFALQGLAWTATGALRTDRGTGLLDLARLARSGVPAGTVLPSGPPQAGLAVTVDDATRAAVAAAGFAPVCTPAD